MKRTSLADEWDEKQRSAARHEAVLDHYRNINQEVGALNDDALKSSSEWWRTDPHRREINPSLEEARVKRLPDYVPDGRDYLLRPGEKDKLLTQRMGMTFESKDAETYFAKRRLDFYQIRYGYTTNWLEEGINGALNSTLSMGGGPAPIGQAEARTCEDSRRCWFALHKYHLCLIAETGIINPWVLFDGTNATSNIAKVYSGDVAYQSECTSFRHESHLMCTNSERMVSLVI